MRVDLLNLLVGVAFAAIWLLVATIQLSRATQHQPRQMS
jgi:hypothetical protein